MRRPLLACLALLAATALSGCENDKVLHFAAGGAASLAVTGMGGSPLQGCAASLALGVAKEVYDQHTGGDVDARDAGATGLGCVVSYRF